MFHVEHSLQETFGVPSSGCLAVVRTVRGSGWVRLGTLVDVAETNL
jgi:hypothetical protein